jgi:hypothetical protein
MVKGSAFRKHLCEGRQECDGSCSPLAQRQSGIRAGCHISKHPTLMLWVRAVSHIGRCSPPSLLPIFHTMIVCLWHRHPNRSGVTVVENVRFWSRSGRFTSNRVVTQWNMALDTAWEGKFDELCSKCGVTQWFTSTNGASWITFRYQDAVDAKTPERSRVWQQGDAPSDQIRCNDKGMTTSETAEQSRMISVKLPTCPIFWLVNWILLRQQLSDIQ